MLVTDGGKLIRSPVLDIRIAGRNTQGVTIFKTTDSEKVVSVARLAENDQDEVGNGDEDNVDPDDSNMELAGSK